MFFHARLVSILLVINAFLAQNGIFGYENHIFISSCGDKCTNGC